MDNVPEGTPYPAHFLDFAKRVWDVLHARLEHGTVVNADGCHEWTQAIGRGGYGVVSWQSAVHRLTWEMEGGPIPEGMVVGHRCNNKLCRCIDHLYLATPGGNSRDAVRDGLYRTGDRHPSRVHPETRPRGDNHWTRRMPDRLERGDDHWSRRFPEQFARLQKIGTAAAATLDEADVREILTLWRTGTWRQDALAAKFRVDRDEISRITTGKRWAHVAPEIPRGTRHANGAANGNARVDADTVRAIRQRAGGGETQKEISAAFGVSPSTVAAIVHRRTWKHVE